MTDDFRRAAIALPFVQQTKDGLDVWSFAAAPEEFAVSQGREFFQAYMSFCRRHRTTALSYHLLDAWCSRPEEMDMTRAAWQFTFGEALLDAPMDATPVLQTARSRLFPAEPRAAMRLLPFVRETDEGGLDCWAVRPSGDYSQDQATGRFYGALICLAIKATRQPMLLAAVGRSMRADRDRFLAAEGIAVGAVTQATEIAMRAPAEHKALPFPQTGSGARDYLSVPAF